MSMLADFGITIAGVGLLAVLFVGGTQIKAVLGDSIYNVFVFIGMIIGLFSSASFFSLLSEIFGSSWVFNLGQYGSLSLIFIILISKLLNWF